MSDEDDRVLVDATEVRVGRPILSWVQETTYSGYKKANTLKYEVAISEQSGLPISWSGPFPGPKSDIEIFRSALKQQMIDFDCIGLADGTYQGENDFLIVPPRNYRNDTPEQRIVRRQHSRRRIKVENFFWRMKVFKILKNTFRHSLAKHQNIFTVVINIISIDLHFRPLRREIIFV
jgi:hypothetical protein